MGIKYLNRFLRDNTVNAIKEVSFKEINGKTVAIDMSIYMYKFIADDTLIESVYSMLSIFQHYKIKPIFVFDGKPPPEKKDTLLKRRENRKNAQNEYNTLSEILSKDESIDDQEKEKMIQKMNTLKKKSIQIKKSDTETVKKIITAFGESYCDASGEADELCAHLTLNKTAWAVLSEDMDMFVYGCPFVIRCMSLFSHTCILYDFSKILEELNITEKEFREICVFSGTDYTTDTKTFNVFEKCIKEKNINFYDCFLKNREYIHKQEDDEFIKNYRMFDLKDKTFNFKIIKSSMSKNEIIEILKTDGFLFPL
jgi:flap endonuclease-1